MRHDVRSLGLERRRSLTRPVHRRSHAPAPVDFVSVSVVSSIIRSYILDIKRLPGIHRIINMSTATLVLFYLYISRP